MTNEEKQLLLKDLCARLPYGVKALETYSGEVVELISIYPRAYSIVAEILSRIGKDNAVTYQNITFFKPYLRQMSNMTEKEAKDYFKNSEYESSECYEAGANNESTTVKAACSADEACVNTDWLNAHHFDYRGLIEKGLALEAPEGMYEIV